MVLPKLWTKIWTIWAKQSPLLICIYLFTRLVRMTSYKSELCSHYKSHVLQNLSLPFLPALRLWAWLKRALHPRMNPRIVFILIFAAITDTVIDFLDWCWRWREFRMVSTDQWWVLVSGLTQLWDVQRVLSRLLYHVSLWYLDAEMIIACGNPKVWPTDGSTHCTGVSAKDAYASKNGKPGDWEIVATSTAKKFPHSPQN